MMIGDGWLVALLVVAAAASVAALGMTVFALVDTRKDLRYIRQRGIGNGRRAAAEGEHLLAWFRLSHAVVALTLTATLAYIDAFVVGLRAQVATPWVVVVTLAAVFGMVIAVQAVVAGRVRQRVLHLGIVDPERPGSDLSSPPEGQR